MFQNAVSGMERMLFARMSPGAYQAVKEVTKLGAIAGSIYGVTDLASKFLGKMAAYAQSVCHSGEPYLDKLHFSTLVHNINAALVSFTSRHQEASMSRLNEYVVGDGKDLNLTGKVAECLATVHNVNPDTVAQFSSKTQEVLMYDYSKLYQVAPELVKYTTVPEVDKIALLVAGLFIGGSILAFKFGQKYFGNMSYKSQQHKEMDVEEISRKLKELRESTKGDLFKTGPVFW